MSGLGQRFKFQSFGEQGVRLLGMRVEVQNGFGVGGGMQRK
jgi:hypothetical protein